jgi:cytochrome P450
VSAISSFAESVTVEDLERDPYPIYARLRADAPVCHIPAVALTLVTRWDDVQYVARHPQLFTADVASSPLTRTLGQNMLTLDGENQKRIRSTIDPSMRPRRVEQYAPGVILPIAEGHLAALGDAAGPS